MKHKLAVGDLLIVILIFSVCAVSAAILYFPDKDTNSVKKVVVNVDGKTYKTYLLTQEADEYISDTGLKLVITGGEAFVAESDCPDKSCVHTSPITADSPLGKSIVCIPNRVTITIDVSDKASYSQNGEVDAVVG